MPVNKIRASNVVPAVSDYQGEWIKFHFNRDTGGIEHASADTVIPNRQIEQTVKVPMSGTAIHAGVTSWVVPVNCIITRLIVDLTTVSSAACTLDIGYTASSATTASATFLDGIDVNAAVAVFDNVNYTGDGTNTTTKAQKAAAGKWITFKELSGNATGLVGNCYITYTVI